MHTAPAGHKLCAHMLLVLGAVLLLKLCARGAHAGRAPAAHCARACC